MNRPGKGRNPAMRGRAWPLACFGGRAFPNGISEMPMPRPFALAALALLATCGIAEAQTTARLPFPDGTYTTRPELCRMTDRQRADRIGYEVILMVRHVEGARMTDGYELDCTIRSVQVTGSTIRYRTTCNLEGRLETSTATMTRIDDRTFRDMRQTFRYCGRFAR
jgi:hypothetical protein